ncbi:hypothetical protein [Nannocystis radixulma]|uniref:Uncharacterized protein n=1 Tax=Nannocystis radixulma TaxID=2995305 RepID=A0ABT5BM73_9BACT|nr:hypothetical protein [Nannocystis radixulma]MDC0675271.1 hypothetical protein [Nannocystis radixulma]
MMLSIVGLLSAGVGHIGLAPSHAEAAQCKVTYSTGPLENLGVSHIA